METRGDEVEDLAALLAFAQHRFPVSALAVAPPWPPPHRDACPLPEPDHIH